jgi:hypothetical protein
MSSMSSVSSGQTGQRFPRPVALLAIAVAVVVAASFAIYALSNVGPVTAPAMSYSQFLADVRAGNVTSVEQTGDALSVSARSGSYVVVVPSILTSVYSDMLAAADQGGVPLSATVFSASPPADTTWLGLLITGVLPLAAVLAIVVLAVVLYRRRDDGGGPDVKRRLSVLDAAWREGLITEEERARKRAQIIEAI